MSFGKFKLSAGKSIRRSLLCLDMFTVSLRTRTGPDSTPEATKFCNAPSTAHRWSADYLEWKCHDNWLEVDTEVRDVRDQLLRMLRTGRGVMDT